MKKEIIKKLHADFEQIVQTEENTKMEFWLARNLQELLGYAKWDNFTKVVDKAITSCKTASHDLNDYFLDVGKMITLEKGGQREIADVAYVSPVRQGSR